MKKVFLGVGHGGIDSGAVSHGIMEKDLNLSIALACSEYLIKYGIDVRLSRRVDEYDPLTDEIAEANEFNPDLAVDIHNNAGGGDGFEVFHEVKGGTSKALAQNIELEVLKVGQNSRGLKTKLNSYGGDWFGFIREVKAPSVLVECAFVDNVEDMKILATSEQKSAMGCAIARGILATLGVDSPTEMKPPYKVEWFSFGEEDTPNTLVESLNLMGFYAEIERIHEGEYTVISYSYGEFDRATNIGEAIKKLTGYHYEVSRV